MKKLCRVVLAGLFVLTLLFNSLPPVKACGPSFVEPIFAFNARPDLNFAGYANGNFGIVKPDYNRSFLFAAYRQFNNQRFTPREQKALVNVWNAEIDRKDSNETNTNAVVKSWIAVRRKVLGDADAPKIYTARQFDGGYDFFPNCTANAFETATKTLESRMAKFGATSGDVKNWTQAQDVVFSNCSEGKSVPAEAEANASGWLRNDRAYQIAAAQFYATNFDDAKVRFETIAATKESVWRTTADYLVARTLIRQANLAYDPYSLEGAEAEKAKQKQKELYIQAEAQLQKILADNAATEFRDSADKLLNLVKYRLHPAERTSELAEKLVQPAENDNLQLDLIDYRWLLDKFGTEADTAAGKRATEQAKAAGKENYETYKIQFTDQPAKTRENDLTDWIFTFQATDQDAFRHSYQKWQETTSKAWFVAAISQAAPANAEVPKLIAEADKLDRAEPAFLTAAYHQIRLLLAAGKNADAKRRLDSILNESRIPYPLSAKNQFAGQRMQVAETLDEFLQFAQRKATAFAYDGSGYETVDLNEKDEKGEFINKDEREWKNRTMFDADSVRIFNEAMPLEVLQQAAMNPQLPKHLQRNLLIAVWTRAVVFGNETIARATAPVLVKTAPEFAPIFARYINAGTPVERKNSAIYILLKTPALRTVAESSYGRRGNVSEIDSYRDNWWCAPSGKYYDNQGNEQTLGELNVPPFITAAQTAVAKRQNDQLKAIGNAPNYLVQEAIDFANRAPQDPRVPETLHLAVAKATRYGCVDETIGKLSKTAFDLLRKNYPASEWAKKTPYWYKGN